MGEPLSNYEAVKAAVGMMGDSRLFSIGARHITVSTVGVIPRIKQMAADLPVGIIAWFAVVCCHVDVLWGLHADSCCMLSGQSHAVEAAACRLLRQSCAWCELAMISM
jgi:hypothetical protein